MEYILTDKALKQTYKKWPTRCNDSEIDEYLNLTRPKLKMPSFVSWLSEPVVFAAGSASVPTA